MSNQPEQMQCFVSCRCEHCDGRIKFDANELCGRLTANVDCPHCHRGIVIYAPKTEPPKPAQNIPDIAQVPPVISDERLHQLHQLSESERGPLYANKREELRLKAAKEQIQMPAPVDERDLREEKLIPKQFSDLIGQNRVKARLELATTAAKSRGEALPHVLLVGPAGLGKATLAHIIAKSLGSSFKCTRGSTIENAGDLAGLLTNLEQGDVLFIDEIQLLQKSIAECLHPAMEDFKLDIIIDQGPNARSVRLSLPHFTLIGTTPLPERVSRNLLSCFPIVESMDAYSNEELAAIACQVADALELEIDKAAAARVAHSSDRTPKDVSNRLRHVRDFAYVKSERIITLEVAEAALKMLVTHEQRPTANESRDAIPSEVRREVWRRDGGKCVKCGSRERLEFDHIIPVTKGGSNTARNIELLCEICNRAKSASIQ